jgi:hypothetical protein
VKDPKRPGMLATRATIREILGVSKQAAHQMTDHPDFPAPLDVPEPRSPIWLRADVEKFAQARKGGS